MNVLIMTVRHTLLFIQQVKIGISLMIEMKMEIIPMFILTEMDTPIWIIKVANEDFLIRRKKGLLQCNSPFSFLYKKL